MWMQKMHLSVSAPLFLGYHLKLWWQLFFNPLLMATPTSANYCWPRRLLLGGDFPPGRTRVENGQLGAHSLHNSAAIVSALQTTEEYLN